MSKEQEQETPVAEQEAVVVEETQSPVQQADDGTIKINMADLQKQSAEPEIIEESEPTIPQLEIVSEVVAEEPVVTEEEIEQPVLQEITEEEVVEQVETIAEEIEQAVVEQQLGNPLPENIQKVVDFIEETGGSLDDYVRLNQDYSSLDETQLLREFYENTKPHLDREDIDFLMEDNFAYDEDIDEDRDIRRKKLARREELQKAKTHLDGMKSKYYEEIKAGSKLSPDQKNAVDFFNRYTKESEEANKTAELSAQTFLQKTDQVFNESFKGFDYSVGDKKYRFNVKDSSGIKETQSDINNFVKKFLNKDNQMSDAKGYHKSLFTAMNADAVANHFYEQGKADAMKDSMKRTKNVDMSPRGAHEKVAASNGWSIRAVPSDNTSSSKLKIRNVK